MSDFVVKYLDTYAPMAMQFKGQNIHCSAVEPGERFDRFVELTVWTGASWGCNGDPRLNVLVEKGYRIVTGIMSQ